MTHSELVSLASVVLKQMGCSVIATEARGLCKEQPDAIGWRGDVSVVIECKTSRADFAVDKKKPFRHGSGMGKWRFYLTPVGLVQSNELPPGWGLLETDGGSIFGLPKGNCWFGGESGNNRDFEAELLLALAILRKQA